MLRCLGDIPPFILLRQEERRVGMRRNSDLKVNLVVNVNPAFP